jgi:ABC-type transport system involved in cytochrome bd biosynthesis fused ATPase/permease subunit
MEVQSLSCNGCGAALDVGPATNFVTCAHCGSRLAVRRTPSSAYTEVLGEIAGHTAQMADNLDIIRLKSELELLDVAWTNKRAEFEKANKRAELERAKKLAEIQKATTTAPKGTGDGGSSASGRGAILVMVGIVSVAAGGVLGGPALGVLAIFGVVMIFVGAFSGIRSGADENNAEQEARKARELEEQARKAWEQEAAARTAALHDAQETYESRRAEILRRLDTHVVAGHRNASGEFVRAA